MNFGWVDAALSTNVGDVVQSTDKSDSMPLSTLVITVCSVHVLPYLLSFYLTTLFGLLGSFTLLMVPVILKVGQ